MKIYMKWWLIAAIVGMFGLTACDEEPTDALKEIIKEDLGYMPVISRFALLTPTAQVKAGTTATFDLRYWTEGKINKIEVWQQPLPAGTATKVSEQGYTPAYSRVTLTDSLLVNYAVPADAAANSQIRVEVRITNVGLENYPKTAFVNVRVNP